MFNAMVEFSHKGGIPILRAASSFNRLSSAVSSARSICTDRTSAQPKPLQTKGFLTFSSRMAREEDRRELSEGVALRFGQNLRRSRQLAGLSQEELGERAALHRTEIGRLERGDRIPRIDTLLRLAGAMAIPAGELVEGIHWTPVQARHGSFTFGTPPRMPDE
jgi:ribosome-binding protein aMBF1 (putative translation factor)